MISRGVMMSSATVHLCQVPVTLRGARRYSRSHLEFARREERKIDMESWIVAVKIDKE